MKVLVLGGTGFIGGRLVGALERAGYTVAGQSRRDGLDLTCLDAVVEHFAALRPEVIMNLAAHVGSVHYGMKHPASVLHDNMGMLLNIYKGVVGVCPDATVINPIANCSYPAAAQVQAEAAWFDGPVDDSALAYGSTRRMTYVVAKCYHDQHGIVSKNLIFPGVYGPGDHCETERVHALDGMIIRMIGAKRKGQPEFEVWGTGAPVREWCFIDDIVELLLRIIKMDLNLIYPVNIGQKKGCMIRELAELIASAVGYRGRLVFNSAYEDGAPVKVLDDRRFRELFPDFVFCDLETGIRKTVEYYMAVL